MPKPDNACRMLRIEPNYWRAWLFFWPEEMMRHHLFTIVYLDMVNMPVGAIFHGTCRYQLICWHSSGHVLSTSYATWFCGAVMLRIYFRSDFSNPDFFWSAGYFSSAPDNSIGFSDNYRFQFKSVMKKPLTIGRLKFLEQRLKGIAVPFEESRK